MWDVWETVEVQKGFWSRDLSEIIRPRLRCGDNIKTYFQEVFSRRGIHDVDWTDLAHDRDRWRALINAVMKLWVP